MNLLITGAWNGALNYMEKLEQMGHTVCFLQFEQDALPCAADWPEGIICNALFQTHDLGQFTNLRYVQLTSAGTDRMPVEELARRGIVLNNARGVYSIPMAEAAILGVLQLYRQAAFFARNQREHRWEKRRDLRELHGRQVCVIGCGSVGAACAERFRAFGCRVNGVELCPGVRDGFDRIVGPDGLDEQLASADVVVLTVPLTKETRGLIDAPRLARMKPDAVLVSISRGGVVDGQALTEALTAGHLGGAVLDVFEQEPLDPESPLWQMEQVIITPHNSFAGDGNRARLDALILGNLEKEQEGSMGWKKSGRKSC